jgi:hypothetical protein
MKGSSSVAKSLNLRFPKGKAAYITPHLAELRRALSVKVRPQRIDPEMAHSTQIEKSEP